MYRTYTYKKYTLLLIFDHIYILFQTYTFYNKLRGCCWFTVAMHVFKYTVWRQAEKSKSAWHHINTPRRNTNITQYRTCRHTHIHTKYTLLLKYNFQRKYRQININLGHPRSQPSNETEEFLYWNNLLLDAETKIMALFTIFIFICSCRVFCYKDYF